MLEMQFESCPAGPGQNDSISLEFIGDVMLHQAQIDNARRSCGSGFDFSEYFRGIEEDLREADLAVANMEFTLAGEPFSGYPAFSAPDAYASYMAECGIDVFLTANNHILDKGEKGLERTLGIYRKMEKDCGTRFTGSSGSEEEEKRIYPLMLNVGGFRLALINFTYGTNVAGRKSYPGAFLTDRKKILDAMRRAQRLDADLIVVLPHWGEEYVLKHSDSQEETALWLAENGADLIVGTHPHVVQDVMYIEAEENGRRRTVPAVFSLGNAISNMSAPNTQIGLMLGVIVARDGDGEACIASLDFTFLWSSLPGRLSESHCTVKVKEHIGKRDLWKQEYEYDKMISSYARVKDITGIKD